MRHLFIAIEGVDGVGKTTVSRLLSDRVGAIYTSTPPPIRGTDALRRMVDGMADSDPFARYLYYLMGDVIVSASVRSSLVERPVVIDRYIASTQAYHAAINGADSLIDPSILGLVLPDITILLTCSEGERLRRIASRDKVDPSDAAMDTDGDLMASVLREYRRMGGYHEIDSTHMSPSETVDVIVALIGERGL